MQANKDRSRTTVRKRFGKPYTKKMNPTLETILKHRSIRKYQEKKIPQDVLERVLEAGTRASNTGNMQVYSVVVTQSAEMKWV